MKLNINSNALAAYSQKLERVHRSALPVAVRSALNSAAFDVKQNTMPAVAGKTFEKRQPNFFKANSKVAPAQGFDIAAMKSTVGFVPLGGTNKAVDDLEQQEHGGTIGGRTFVPLDRARIGNSRRRNVKRGARISGVRNIVDARKAKGRSDAEKYTRSALHAGKGGWLLGNRVNNTGNRILFQVRSLVRKDGNTVVKAVPMFAVKTGRAVKPKATHFMEEASRKSATGLEKHFITAAVKQLNKIRK